MAATIKSIGSRGQEVILYATGWTERRETKSSSSLSLGGGALILVQACMQASKHSLRLSRRRLQGRSISNRRHAVSCIVLALKQS
jgi:hypothetical protein